MHHNHISWCHSYLCCGPLCFFSPFSLLQESGFCERPSKQDCLASSWLHLLEGSKRGVYASSAWNKRKHILTVPSDLFPLPHLSLALLFPFFVHMNLLKDLDLWIWTERIRPTFGKRSHISFVWLDKGIHDVRKKQAHSLVCFITRTQPLPWVLLIVSRVLELNKSPP